MSYDTWLTTDETEWGEPEVEKPDDGVCESCLGEGCDACPDRVLVNPPAMRDIARECMDAVRVANRQAALGPDRDVVAAVRASVEKTVRAELDRDAADWRDRKAIRTGSTRRAS